MSNLYRALQDLLKTPPLQVGTVTAITGGVATVQTPDGNTLQARGSATVGQRVYVKDGAIDGEAPALTLVQITV